MPNRQTPAFNSGVPPTGPGASGIAAALDAAISGAVLGEVGEAHQSGLTNPGSPGGHPAGHMADGRTVPVDDEPAWTQTGWAAIP
jgi:hypothetical protein